MNVARIVIPLIILAAGVAGFLALGAKQKEERRSPDEGQAAMVEVTAVAQHRGPLEIHVNGHVVPYREIDLSAEVAGRVTFKAEEARAGRFVKEKTVLFRVDNRDYSLAVARLDNQVKQAGESIKELEEEIAGAKRLVELGEDQFTLAKNEYDRQLELHRGGVSTDSERDKYRREVIAAENALTTVRNQKLVLETRRNRLTQAQELFSLQKEKAEHDLARTTIISPVAGVVVSDSVERDDYVNVGTPLVSIEDTSAVEVKCNLLMDELYWIWDQAGASTGASDGELAEVSPDGDYQIRPTPATVTYRLQGRDYFWKGELWRFDGIGLDERTRTVPCRVIVRSPREVWVKEDGQEQEASGGPPALVRGMYVDVAIRATPESRLFVVPETAVRPAAKHEKVWVAREAKDDEPAGGGNGPSGTHVLQAVNVDIVEVVGENAIVRASGDGLAEGDPVLVLPLGMERDGMPVTLAEPAKAEAEEKQEG